MCRRLLPNGFTLGRNGIVLRNMQHAGFEVECSALGSCAGVFHARTGAKLYTNGAPGPYSRPSAPALFSASGSWGVGAQSDVRRWDSLKSSGFLFRILLCALDIPASQMQVPLPSHRPLLACRRRSLDGAPPMLPDTRVTRRGTSPAQPLSRAAARP